MDGWYKRVLQDTRSLTGRQHHLTDGDHQRPCGQGDPDDGHPHHPLDEQVLREASVTTHEPPSSPGDKYIQL